MDVCQSGEATQGIDDGANFPGKQTSCLATPFNNTQRKCVIVLLISLTDEMRHVLFTEPSHEPL